MMRMMTRSSFDAWAPDICEQNVFCDICGAFFVGDECDGPDDGRDDGHDDDSDESDSLREHVHDAHIVV